MPADPQDPGPARESAPAPGGRPEAHEDQEQILAWEMAAFPDDDEPDWEALEYLEYFDEPGSGDAEPWPMAPPGLDPPRSVPPGPELPGPIQAGSVPPGPGLPGSVLPGSVLPEPVPPGSVSSGSVPPGPELLGPIQAGSVPPGPGLPGPVPGDGRAASAAAVPGADGEPAVVVGSAVPGDPSAAGLPAGACPGGARAGSEFAHDGVADVMLPGPELAALAGRVWQAGLDGLDDDEITGVLQAADRLGAWSAALKLSAVSGIAARREAQGRKSGDWRPFEHAEDEVAIALTLTRHGAGYVLNLALGLDRLPLTRAALAAGAIDERRAYVIADEVAGLDDEHAAAVEACVIGKAAGQTTGQLRSAVRRAVIAADPAAAKRRKEEALKGARVEASQEASGTARLSGRDLPPAEVLAADRYLTALAQGLKRAGAPGTMDQLRARAYLHLLAGGAPATLLMPPASGTPASGTPASGTPASGTPASGIPASDAPASGTPGGGTSSDGTLGDSAPAGGTSDGGAPGDGTPGDGMHGAGVGSQGGTGTGAAGLELSALRGTVNLTMPLAAWLGWSQSPGQVPGFGTLDADDSRALAAMLARDPATKWCITLTDPAGHAVAHGCAKHGPSPGPGPSGPDSGHDGEPGPGPGSRSGSRSGLGPRAGPPPDHGPGSRAGPGPAPPGDHGWLRTVMITPLQAGTCTHSRETQDYQPSRALRHIIEIRQATCSRPGCRRAATACDLDHTIPYHLGGRTCECDLGPVCRHDHHLKQAPGWTLTQTQPGLMTWTTPGRRTYTTGPTSYPE